MNRCYCCLVVPAANARTRLMRLSEAAESLQKRAANSVLVGKETEARELLVEKKKLMQALEKSKNRIDVLDKLAIKINEVGEHFLPLRVRLVGFLKSKKRKLT
ncbi:uncharacterized protein LOC109835700 isoform X2 [Asparagus officinalis]|uniref:uncharacterized protein LOC109835700 isoform X2 n=1 Tax=Asparagus officinalis TaxID=4686 RepID=UPI00098E5D0F|nr:uncharacterized protein LOC109835700 isoform X2 [Asparagus officinalis]